MIQKLIQPHKVEVLPPKGFVKVTNLRKGELLLPCPPFVLPAGVSYHDEKLFDEMAKNDPDGKPGKYMAVVDALRAHAADGELKFESADVAPPPPAPVPFIPQAVSPDAPAPVIVPLSADPAAAAAQIAAETNEATLAAWFDAASSPEISNLLQVRHEALSKA